MDNKALTDFLISNDACEPARMWVDGQDLADAWANCPRADWMLWLAARLNPEAAQRGAYACAARAAAGYAADAGYAAAAAGYAAELADLVRATIPLSDLGA